MAVNTGIDIRIDTDDEEASIENTDGDIEGIDTAAGGGGTPSTVCCGSSMPRLVST